MKQWIQLLPLLLYAAVSPGEIIDRVAVTVGPSVITESEIKDEIRLRAFLEREPLDFSAVAKRKAADRLVEQRLIRRELEVSTYPAAPPETTEQLLSDLKTSHFSGDLARYRASLEEYRISEKSLKDRLRWQLTVVEFVSFRFRPGIQIKAEEIEAYFSKHFLPKLQKISGESPVVPDEYRDEIELILIEERVNQQLDQWLTETKERTKIDYREEAFR